MALLAAACSGNDRSARTTAEPAEQPAALEAATPLPAGMWAGTVAGSDAFVAVVNGPQGGVVYVCDDGTIAEWFRGDVLSPSNVLANAAGSRVALASDGGRLSGTLYLASARALLSFTADPAATSPLQRSFTLTDEEVATAGWITLPDGRRRGSLTTTPRTPNVVAPVPSGPAGTGVTVPTTVRATVPTTVRAPAPVTVPVTMPGTVPVTVALTANAPVTAATPSTLPPVAGTPAVSKTIPAPAMSTSVPMPVAGTRLSLAPANPMTPDTTRAPTANPAPEFVWTALGDSFASGEGAPVRNGGVDLGQTRPDWGPAISGDVTLDERQACHRSEAAGAPLANAALAAEFPEVTFRFRHYACSGAQIRDLREAGYDGPDRTTRVAQPAQVGRAAAFARQFSSYDAMYLNIGGNDAGFGTIIQNCLLEAACQEKGTAMAIEDDTIARRLDSLPGRYADLDRFIREFTDGAGRRITPRNILITKFPDFISTPTGVCGDGAGANGAELTALISRDEARWARDTVLTRLNQGVDSTASLGWIPVDGHLAAFQGRGFCTANPMANTNNAALATQGDDYDVPLVREVLVSFAIAAGAVAGSPFFGPVGAAVGAVAAGIAAAGTVKLSAGILHPNRAGFQAYGTAIAEELRPLVLAKLRAGLEAPRRVRVAAAVPRGDITFRWDDQSSTETRYEVTTTLVEGDGTLAPTTVTLPANSQEFTVRLNGRAVVRLEVRACVRDVCSAPASGTGANVAPVTPTDGTGSYNAVKSPVSGAWQTSLMVGWASSPHSLAALVEFRNTATGEVFKAVVNGALTMAGLRIADPAYGTTSGAPKGRYAVRAAACNRAGCSPFSAEIEVDASGAAREIDLSRQRLDSSPVPLADVLLDPPGRLGPSGFGPALPGERVPGSGPRPSPGS